MSFKSSLWPWMRKTRLKLIWLMHSTLKMLNTFNWFRNYRAKLAVLINKRPPNWSLIFSRETQFKWNSWKASKLINQKWLSTQLMKARMSRLHHLVSSFPRNLDLFTARKTNRPIQIRLMELNQMTKLTWRNLWLLSKIMSLKKHKNMMTHLTKMLQSPLMSIDKLKRCFNEWKMYFYLQNKNRILKQPYYLSKQTNLCLSN